MTQPRSDSDPAATPAMPPEAEPHARSEAGSPRVTEKLARFLELLDGEMSGRGEARTASRG